MSHAIVPFLAAAILGQSPTPDERLDFMKSEAKAYHFEKEGDRGVALKLRDEPAFRLGKQPGTDVEDGAIFFWEDEVGRPIVSFQLFLVKNEKVPDGMWAHEFITLTPDSLVGTRRGRPSWSPGRPGIEYHKLDDVPKPAATATLRMRQMKAIMQDFQATDYLGDKSWSDLRLLPTPVARYGKEGSAVIDGALFAFAFGTDPEVCVLVEARQGKDGPEWYYAMGPMTCFSIKGTYKKKEVYDLPRRVPVGDPKDIYWSMVERL